jgi:hypothetical protein
MKKHFTAFLIFKKNMYYDLALALSTRGSDSRARAHARRSLLPPSAKRSSVEHHWF